MFKTSLLIIINVSFYFMNILIFGCAGFIGINLTHHFLKKKHKVFGVDKLTYASNINEINLLKKNINFKFFKLDIKSKQIERIIDKSQPKWIINLAAESHVDNSINNPNKFITTNINGLYNILLFTERYYKKLKGLNKKNFKFLQISTDEVYGSLIRGSANENFKYNPSSPYSASKASADMLVNSWNVTYKLPTIISYSCNNFGPFQNKEKLIPKVLLSLKNSKKIPVYGNGMNKREWIFVKDHILAIEQILNKGKTGNTYNIGSKNNISNLDLIKKIIKIVKKKNYLNLDKKLSHYIDFVKDRKGHDFRYSLNCNKIKKKLSWKEKYTFEESLEKTIFHYFLYKL